MQNSPDPNVLSIQEGRFARLEAVSWWDQARLFRTKILVIGAGALGNEVIKNLALLGIGHVVVVDMDRVELSNLSRSVLFREADEGRFKAECAVEAARKIFPQIQAAPLIGNVLSDVGLGWFRWADAVIGALDNREARVFVNSACARVQRPWFDGGIEVLHGVVRGFAPPRTACYECTMGETDWTLLAKRRSCSLLARRAIAERGTPTTPTTASVIGAMQVQEVIKHLHGRSALLGAGFFFDGVEHNSYRVTYPVHPDCPWHEPPVEISASSFNSGTPLQELWNAAAERVPRVDALDLSRELVEQVECAACLKSWEVFMPAERLQADQLICPQCRKEAAPVFFHSISVGSPLLRKSAREIGLPPRDIVWARSSERSIGFELADARGNRSTDA